MLSLQVYAGSTFLSARDIASTPTLLNSMRELQERSSPFKILIPSSTIVIPSSTIVISRQ